MKPAAVSPNLRRILAGLVLFVGMGAFAAGEPRATGDLAMLLVAALGNPDLAAPAALPAVVSQAVRECFPGSTITAFRSELEDGCRFYMVALDRDGDTTTVTVAPDGSFGEIKSSVSVARLPAGDQVRIHRAVHGGQIRHIERQVRVGRAQRGAFVHMSEPAGWYVVSFVRPGRTRVSCARLPLAPAVAGAASPQVMAPRPPAKHD